MTALNRPPDAMPSPAPRVSAVIPLYNCLALTRRCLETLQATLPADLTHEIIFVDDGSTDGTREWLATLAPPCRVVLNGRNLGFAAGCNRGAAAARGEFLALLNNDLELLPGWLEPLLAGFTRLPGAGCLGNVQLNFATRELDHAGIAIGADGKPAHVRTRPAESPGTPGYAAMVAVTGACAVVPRALFAGLGGFDEGFVNGGEDIDFCLRARAAGHTVWTALQSTVLHHVSASPGRKRCDEENSYRLFRRWRPALEQAAWRAWSEAFLVDVRAGALPHHPPAEKAAESFLGGRQLRPGRWAETNVAQNLLTEEARWERMFPDAPNPPLAPAGAAPR
jgi:GT2 family glycosyltransferase